MHPEVVKISQAFADDLEQAETTKQLEEMKVRYLGKKGPVTSLMRLLKDVSKEEKPLLGKQINDLKVSVETALEKREHELFEKELEVALKEEILDITLPGRQIEQGRMHPISEMLERVLSVLKSMGFSIQYGPVIDTDYFNFEVLNFPKDHPARDEHDTYYLPGGHLLRTHTSNVQARVMEKEKPPIRVAVPGKCFRNETITARSHVHFHQVEGFYIDKGVTFSDLFSTLSEFLKKLFGPKVQLRFRASYFPFVEPGMEVDLLCLLCEGKGCSVCKKTGWLEILGAGMIHPEVLKSVSIDPEEYTGFAWGMGIERILMIQKGIPDIRYFFENDLRFLGQFSSV